MFDMKVCRQCGVKRRLFTSAWVKEKALTGTIWYCPDCWRTVVEQRQKHEEERRREQEEARRKQEEAQRRKLTPFPAEVAALLRQQQEEAQRRKQEEEARRIEEEAQRIEEAKAYFSPDPTLKGDALLVRLIKAYRTATFGTFFTPEAVQNAAREFIERAGPGAVDTAIEWLNECKACNAGDYFFDDFDNKKLICAKTKGDLNDHDYVFLIKLLTEIGDERAVEPLLRRFRADEAQWRPANQIARFFARIGAKQAAQGLIPYLDTHYDLTRCAAAYGLGLLAVEETRDALLSALDRYGHWVKEGLKDADTDFAKSLISEWDAKRKATGPRVESMTDDQMVEILRALCNAYMTSNRAEVRRLEPLATDIGEELNRRGGIQEMRRVFSLLGGISGSRTLEMHWSGIGQWRG